MALSLATVGGKITAAFINAIIGVVNRQGTTSVIPTSVSGTGVTLGSGGKVSFTASTTISVNGCFTSEFDNYLIVITLSAASATSGVFLRWRGSGTDSTAATWFNSQGEVSAAGAWTSTAVSAQTLSTIGRTGASGSFIRADVAGPARTTPKRISATTIDSDNIGGPRWSNSTTATAFDGFTVLSNSATTYTGTIRIYGYNNN